MKLKVFTQSTLLSMIIFTSACIHGITPKAVADIKYILFSPTSRQSIDFQRALEKHPELIDFNLQNTTEFSHGQTLARWVINQMNLNLLNIMYDHGETMASVPNENDPNTSALKTTGYLTLCFHINKLAPTPEQQQILYLSLLQKFAERTPDLIVTPRHDGMTPAMAIAASNSPLKAKALQILKQHHPHAFNGYTKQRFSLLKILLTSQETTESIHALHLILESKKEEPGFGHELARLAQFIHSSIHAKPNYLEVITKYLQSSPSPSSAINLPPTPTINQAPNCFCCNNQCFCCQQPNPYHPDHTQWWITYYQTNPKNH